MSQDMYQDIQEFREKFSKELYAKPRLLSKSEMMFRIHSIMEELVELMDNYDYDPSLEQDDNKIFVGKLENQYTAQVDAIIDLMYFALGTLSQMGLSRIKFYECWTEVHQKNMSKIPAHKYNKTSRGSTQDIVKPEGFVPPDLKKIIFPEETDA